MVDGVVQEEDLSGLDEDGCQRQKVCIDQSVDACCQDVHDTGHQRAHDVGAEDGKEHAQDTDGEVVDQHLEACGHLVFHELVELLDDPACQRAHDHGAHQHGLTVCAAYACDCTHDSDGTDDTAAGAADHLTACISDQNGKQVEQHVGLNGCKLFVGKPACRNEQGCDKAPGDECTDVGHDHR